MGEKERKIKKMVVWSGIGRIPKYLKEYIKAKKDKERK